MNLVLDNRVLVAGLGYVGLPLALGAARVAGPWPNSGRWCPWSIPTWTRRALSTTPSWSGAPTRQADLTS